jgi:HK97 family phage major capsid protein
MSKYLTPVQRELLAVLTETDSTSRQEPTRQTEQRMNFLLAKIKALQALPSTAAQSSECRDWFRNVLAGKEYRTMQEGQPAPGTLGYVTGNEGGYLVPQEFNDDVIHGMAQFDPLLDKDVVTLIESKDFSLKPFVIPGWDLSTFAATKVSETSGPTASTPPLVAGKLLNSYKYAAALPISIELEEDAFEPMMKIMNDAYVIAFARGIGVDLAIGNGTTAPQGVLTGAGASVYTTASSTALVLNDFESVYFQVNRIHRNAPKCAWLMSDSVYQMARKAVDTVGNPLLKVHKDKEMIMGKPVLVSPSLPAYNASIGAQAGTFCVFGDLSHMFVRVSKMILHRSWQAQGYVEKGQALYSGYMRADAKVFDPTSGGTPPIVSASL